jgi:LPS export ABC transporter protein LptC
MAMTMDSRGLAARSGSALRGVPSAADRARDFRRAGRHTSLVRILRLGLPIAAAGCTAFYGLTLGVSWQIGKGRLNMGEVHVTADDLTMKNPSYFGLTKEGGRYEVRAKQAVVEFNQQAPIKLIDVDGDLVQTNNVVTKLKAKHGLLDNTKNELELYDGIEIDASNGLKARMTRATVYSKENRIVSKLPVDVWMPTGRVTGSAMTLRTDTRQSTFVGDVTVRLVSAAPASQPGQVVQPAQPGAVFGRDARQPVDVKSETLHVDDFAKTAVFMGQVVAVQGDTMLKTPELRVAYEGKAADQLTGPATPEAGGEASRLSRLAAINGSVVTIGTDRRIVSDQADFDAKADTALFTGNVLVNQQRNVLQGQRLFVDRKAGRTRLETPAAGGQPAGRIAATFYQNQPAATPAQKAKSAAADAATSVAAATQQNVLGTFKTDPNAPIDIESDTLDVVDSAKQAIFRGNVKSQQGDFIVRTVEMTAFYTGQTGFGMGSAGEAGADKAAQNGAQGGTQLTRVEAKQKVLITSKDGQTATGDWAIFDVKANTVLLGDRVIVSRGKDVAQGPRLKIDLTTGMYRFELEAEPAVASAGPATSASAPQTAPAPPPSTDPTTRACPPGKQCLLVYPGDLRATAKETAKKVVPQATAPDKASDGWKPSNSASPVLRSD